MHPDLLITPPSWNSIRRETRQQDRSLPRCRPGSVIRTTFWQRPWPTCSSWRFRPASRDVADL